MNNELLIGGVLFSPIVAACVLALIGTTLLSMLLVRIGFYRLTWNRPMVEVSIFCILLAAAGWLPFVGIST